MYNDIKQMKKGFTLIEMLIVVAIIGILAGAVLVGLGPVQKGGRDARRLSDLRQVQNGLELYYNKNQKYPTGIGSWDALRNTLTGAGIGVANVPQDPKSGATYYYASDGNGTTYVLGAILEDPNSNATRSSFIGSPPTGGMGFPTSCGATLSGPPGPGFMYCLTL